MEVIRIIKDGNYDGFLTWLNDNKPSEKDIFPDGVSLLHWASSSINLNILKEIYSQFPSIINNINPSDGCTPLHWATLDNYLENVIFLLDNNAGIQADHMGETPLHLSSMNGHFEITEKLLLIGGKDFINVQSQEGNTALHFAVMNSHKRIISLLLSNGADPNILNNQNLSPIIIAKTTNPPVIDMFDPIKSELHNEIEDLQFKNNELEKQMNELKISKFNLEQKVIEQSKIIHKLTETNSGLEDQIEDLSSSILKQKEIIQKLQSNFDEKEIQLQNLHVDYNILKEQYNAKDNPIETIFPDELVKLRSEDAITFFLRTSSSQILRK